VSEKSERDYALRYLAGRPANDDASGTALLETLRRIVPFDQYCISGLDIDGCQVGGGIFLSSNFSREFLEEYTESQLLQVDALAQKVSEQSPIASWHEIPPADITEKGAQDFEELLRRNEILPRTGFSFWRDGRLNSAVIFGRTRPFIDQELAILDIFSEPLHSATALPILTALNENLRLSPGEIKCLRAAADGMSSEQIASDVGYATDTVNSYLKSAMKKMGATNRTQAVVSAVRRKII
jgi:DNA-binding CsgD family transcriptional regulator